MPTGRKCAVRAAAIAGSVALASLTGQAGATPPAPVTPTEADPAGPGAHYSGKGLLNPDADLSAPPAHTPGQTPGLPTDSAASIGDAHRFNTWSGYPSGPYPEGVTTGDFNADGAVDVAYARNDFQAQGMTVQLNRGDGTLGSIKSYPSTSQSSDIKAGDLDGDVDLDLVVVSMGSSLQNTVIDLYFNDGDAKFTRRTDTGGLGPQKLALADLDADGDLDLAMSSGWFEEVISVLLNNGDGTFAPERRYTVGENPKGIAAADFNGDGDIDLAVGRQDPSNQAYVQIWSNDGGAKFTKSREITLVQLGDPSLAADDFDDDGKADLVVGLVGTENQVVMLNQGGLAFDQDVYATGFSAWDVSTGDLDGDGDADVALATAGSSSTGDMSILRNRRKGSSFKYIPFQSGFNPHDAAIADFDADGKADIVVAQGGTETGGIHLQRRGFTFGPPDLAPTQLPVGSVESSDVNHDDDLDLAIAINDPFGGIGYVQIMDNPGNAAFREGQLIPSGLSSRGQVGHVQPADLNGDGWDDLVWSLDQFSEPVGPIVTSMNDGTGEFSPPTVFPGTARNAYVAVGDLDDDGDIDLAAAQFTEQIAVYLNKGNGTFKPALIVPVAEFPNMVIASDLSGDGVLDLATVHNGVYGSSKAISVLRGTGGGKFAPYVKYTVGQGPIEIVATDLDEDGDLDLATSNNGGDDTSTFADESTTVLLNKGNGTYDKITTYPGEAVYSYLSEWAINAADIDGDGNVDIVVSNVLGNNVGIYYGRGDGTLDPQQVRYGVQNGAQDMTVADFNGDGRPDIAAAGYLLSVDPFFPPAGIVVLKNQRPRQL